MIPGHDDRTRVFGPGAPATPGDLPARRRVGPYEVLGVIAQGGMGAVYRVRDPKLGREVALKIMIGGAWTGERAHRRFLREAQIMAELRHPGIVPVHDLGIEDGLPYYTMDLVEGEPLDRAVARRNLPLGERLRIFLKACDAVQHAHFRGVIHQDLKPANILVTGAGNPMVLDFGIAGFSECGDGEARLTASGVVQGTPAYMAPEQVRGDTQAIDVRTDVYALGVVLYELATGAAPFRATETFALLQAVLEQEPPRPDAGGRPIPADLAAVILKAMAKDPVRRYASAGALARDLERFLDGLPVEAHPDSAAYRLAKWIRRHRELAVSVAAAGLALAFLGAWSVLRIYREGERAKENLRLFMQESELREHRLKAEALANDATRIERLDPAEALRMIEKAVALEPGFARSHSAQGDMLMRQGDPEKAAQAYAQALRIDPGHIRAQIAYGTMLWELGKGAEALQAFDKALEIDSRCPEAHANRAAVLWKTGKTEEALKAFRQALEIDPRNAYALCCVGRILDQAGRLDEAMEAYEASRAADQGFMMVHFAIANLLLQKDRSAEALEAAERGLALNPRNAGLHLLRGQILAWGGEIREAEEAFRNALKFGLPETAAKNCRDALNGVQAWLRAEVLLEQASAVSRSDPAAAMRLLDEAVVIAPSYANAHRARGILLHAQGRLEEALQESEAAQKIGLKDRNAEECRKLIEAIRSKMPPAP